jgi:hypothetical protein
VRKPNLASLALGQSTVTATVLACLPSLGRAEWDTIGRIKTETVLPSAEIAATLFWALLASGQITMRKVDGWQHSPPSQLFNALTLLHDTITSSRRRCCWHANFYQLRELRHAGHLMKWCELLKFVQASFTAAAHAQKGGIFGLNPFLITHFPQSRNAW